MISDEEYAKKVKNLLILCILGTVLGVVGILLVDAGKYVNIKIGMAIIDGIILVALLVLAYIFSKKKKLAEDVNLKTIAKNTSGFAGADLENVLNEAALLAARRNIKEIGMKEIEDAMVKVTMGPEKKTRVRSEKENKLVAYHEAGHAVVSRFLPTQDPVHQISIVPRGMAGGYTMYRPTEDKNFMSKSEMEENIVSLLGR